MWKLCWDFLLCALSRCIVIPNEEFVQLVEHRDIYGRKLFLASRRTEKEKKANFLLVVKYASVIAG